VAATIGILFWGWLWGVMGLLLAVPLTAFVKLVADLHPSLCHLSNMLAADAASDSALGALRRNGFGTGNSLLASPSGKSSCRALTLGDRELRSTIAALVVFGRYGRLHKAAISNRLRSEKDRFLHAVSDSAQQCRSD
jgi:hypothetical protein